VEFKDYYQMLGVARDASPEAIKKAYRQLARKYHPDVSKEPDAAARMSEVNEAYAVLSDPERKAAYDNVGQGHQGGEHFTPPPGWDSGYEFSGSGFEQMDPGEFSEFFSQLFGRAGAARHHARRPAGGGRGEDRHARIELALEDAFTGGLRHLTCSTPRWMPRAGCRCVRGCWRCRSRAACGRASSSAWPGRAGRASRRAICCWK
jgi:curved DNA-binding protein